MGEILKLLRENNAMLKEILFFLKRYEENDDMRQFSINVAADLFLIISIIIFAAASIACSYIPPSCKSGKLHHSHTSL